MRIGSLENSIMTFKVKSNPTKTKINEGEDTRWRSKGHAHRVLDPEPDVCPYCLGRGYHIHDHGKEECVTCNGTGEIWL